MYTTRLLRRKTGVRRRESSLSFLFSPAQVLLCHMSPEQFELYVEFLETQKATFAKLADEVLDGEEDVDDDRGRGNRRSKEREAKEERRRRRILFTLTVLRKIANHPDLLVLQEKDRLMDYGNPARSACMNFYLVEVQCQSVWTSSFSASGRLSSARRAQTIGSVPAS